VEPAVAEESTAQRVGNGQTPISEDELFADGRSWYVIHTYSGYEDKVKTNLEQRIKSMDAEELVFRVVVPSVDEIEIKEGQRRTVPRKSFPGNESTRTLTGSPG